MFRVGCCSTPQRVNVVVRKAIIRSCWRSATVDVLEEYNSHYGNSIVRPKFVVPSNAAWCNELFRNFPLGYRLQNICRMIHAGDVSLDSVLVNRLRVLDYNFTYDSGAHSLKPAIDSHSDDAGNISLHEAISRASADFPPPLQDVSWLNIYGRNPL